MNSVDFAKLSVTKHAIDEVVRDFPIAREHARNWITDSLIKAKFIASTIGKDGKPSRMYGYRRTVFVLAADKEAVMTVYRNDTPAAAIKRRVDAMVTRELRKIERRESVLERKHALIKAELSVEKAQLELRILRAKGPATKLASQARINAINEYFAQLDADLLTVKHEKRAVAKTVVAYL